MTVRDGMTETVAEGSADGAVRRDRPGGRFIDRFDRRLVNAVTVLGYVLPVAGYFWMVHRYSVNVIFGDQWDDVTVINHSYSHLFDWSSLWAQHNENRIFFPNLIVVLLAHNFHFNIQVEEYLGAVMLVVATGLVIWAHKRRAMSTPWLYYCPVVVLALSTVQYENSLWGFQMAWYLVLVSLAAAIVLIDRPTLTWLTLAAAIVAGVVGSFSSLQGLLIWPAGLVLLYHRRRAVPFVVAWIAATAAALFLYLYNFNTSATAGSPSHGYVLHHPVAAIKFYVFEVGDIVGLPRRYNGPGSNAVLLLGLVILVLAGLILVAYGLRRDDSGGGPIGIALICVGLLFVVIVDVGRVRFGYLGASASRYTTYDLLIPIGIFLALLGRPLPSRRAAAVWIDRVLMPAARWVVAAVIVVQVSFGLHYGPTGAGSDHAYQAHAARVLRNIDRTPDGEVGYYLYLLQSPSFIRHQARIAQLHHLSLFADRTS